MSKITNNDLTWSGTGCFIAVYMWKQWASKGQLINIVSLCYCTLFDKFMSNS